MCPPIQNDGDSSATPAPRHPGNLVDVGNSVHGRGDSVGGGDAVGMDGWAAGDLQMVVCKYKEDIAWLQEIRSDVWDIMRKCECLNECECSF